MIPDRVIFIDVIPRTGVGKFLKRELRERFHSLLTG
jgi:acyl-CoA synthetase (AMP-forming)/AMP-acid ligase II